MITLSEFSLSGAAHSIRELSVIILGVYLMAQSSRRERGSMQNDAQGSEVEALRLKIERRIASWSSFLHLPCGGTSQPATPGTAVRRLAEVNVIGQAKRVVRVRATRRCQASQAGHPSKGEKGKPC